MFWMFKDLVVIMKEIMPWLFQYHLTVTWLNLTMPSQTVKYGLKPKKIKFLQMNFFLEKQLIKVSCTYCPLSFCRIWKKTLRVDPESRGRAIFGPKIAHWYKPLLLLRAFTLPPAWGVGRVPFRKSLRGGQGCWNFYFGVGDYIVGGRGNFAGGVT